MVVGVRNVGAEATEKPRPWGRVPRVLPRCPPMSVDDPVLGPHVPRFPATCSDTRPSLTSDQN